MTQLQANPNSMLRSPVGCAEALTVFLDLRKMTSVDATRREVVFRQNRGDWDMVKAIDDVFDDLTLTVAAAQYAERVRPAAPIDLSGYARAQRR
jgi:hypothetical protein